MTNILLDCYDYYKQGYLRNAVLPIRPRTAPSCDTAKMSCDMLSGGMTTIMRRMNGDVDFYRNWTEYKQGFGEPSKEHWLGNDLIHYMTTQHSYSLRIELEDWQGNKKHALYDVFQIKSEIEGYELVVGGYQGTAGDSFGVHNGKKFSTFDVDNDDAPENFWNGNCAKRCVSII
jgi:hypothetical protein